MIIVESINNGSIGSGSIVYWMSREQRVSDNWGLFHAQQIALEENQRLLVVFTLANSFIGDTVRHYGFMLRGLEQVALRLVDLNIPFIFLRGEPQHSILRFIEQEKIGAVICYLAVSVL